VRSFRAMKSMLETLPFALLSCLLSTACIVDVEEDVDETWEEGWEEPDYDADATAALTAAKPQLAPVAAPLSVQKPPTYQAIPRYEWNCDWKGCPVSFTTYCGVMSDVKECHGTLPNTNTYSSCQLRQKPVSSGVTCP